MSMAEQGPAPRKHPVYVVEDDADVSRSLAMLLKLNGFDPICFESADSLLNSIEVLRPGCLLLDVRLPGLDGISALQELRKRKIGWPAIFMSGHLDAGMAARAARAGGLGLLEKPFSEEDLVAALDRAERALDEPAP